MSPGGERDGNDPSASERVEQTNVLGSFIRAQRQMANLSLRQLSALAHVSNPYLSQVERGLSEPSVRVLRAIAAALNLSAEAMFEQAGLIEVPEHVDDRATEAALRADRRLTESQKHALLSVYRSYLEANGGTAPPSRSSATEHPNVQQSTA